MRRFCLLLSLLVFFAASSFSVAIALPSMGLGSLSGGSRSSSQSEQQRLYGKQNSVSQDDDRMETLQPDQSAPTRPVSYGNTDQAGVNAQGNRVVHTDAPKPQAQTPAPKQYQNVLTQWSYYNKGNGVNVAVPAPPSGQPWYSYPPMRQLQAKHATAATQAALKFFPQLPGTVGSAMPSNSIMQANFMSAAFAAGQLMNSPKRQVETATANAQGQQQEASDASADGAEHALQTGVDLFRTQLINVANEGAASPTSAEAPFKELSQVVWMVQQMYKNVYFPLAILLLLPGAILTNLKGLIAGGFFGHRQDEDASSPFTAILRTVIAIFLIPATQVIISWSIDIGNSMTYEVQQFVTTTQLLQWAQEQTFNAPLSNAKNALTMPKDMQTIDQVAQEAAQGGGGGGASDKIAGKIDGGSEKSSQVEQQGTATRMLQMAFNMLNMAMSFGLLLLCAFQTVMMCYLLLMGPIAAAFYAWPSGCGSLFKNVFANWVNAVINLALWRFWWCVVLLCMQTRIQWLIESGDYIPNAQWEMAVYTAFMVILLYVPFVPFEYKPGEMVSKILEKAQDLEQAAQSGGGGGGGSGGGGASAGHSAGHSAQQSHQSGTMNGSGSRQPGSNQGQGPDVPPPPPANDGQPKIWLGGKAMPYNPFEHSDLIKT